MKAYISSILFLAASTSWASTPIFSVTPIVGGQAQLVSGDIGTYIYQVTNNTNYTLSNIGFYNLPSGVQAVDGDVSNTEYCSFPLTLASQGSCILKLSINSAISVNGGPKLCLNPSLPVYCSQPLLPDQMSTQIIPGPISPACWDNVSNFNAELRNPFGTTLAGDGWGPSLGLMNLSSSNPNLTSCPTSSNTGTPSSAGTPSFNFAACQTAGNSSDVCWQQARLIAAEDFWVRQKLNYCHHHVFDYYTPLYVDGINRNNISGTGPTPGDDSGGGYCNATTDMAPGTPYYGQQARWNYSGSGSETLNNWVNNNGMWYGVDCSDFTAFAYDFAFGNAFNNNSGYIFSSDTGYQAGQKTDGSQNYLTPNNQSHCSDLSAGGSGGAAGTLLCLDGTLDSGGGSYCSGHGGYFSIYGPTTTCGDATHSPLTNVIPIPAANYNNLQPGDLIFLGFEKNPDGSDPGLSSSIVKHVITWTGKQVGYGPYDVNPSQIAPEPTCPNNWQPQVGDWVIIDSHYQGPDYRVFSACFYQAYLYAVRRVIQN